MYRVYVVGTSGSGKSTLAAMIAEPIDAPWIQLDALFHRSGWSQVTRAELRGEVEARTAGDRWVVDGNYANALGDLVLARSDTVVSLELPRCTVMRQLLWRTGRRIVMREKLWSGNRETLRRAISRKDSILVWAWNSHGQSEQRVAVAQANPAFRGVRFVRLRSRRQIAEFIDQLL